MRRSSRNSFSFPDFSLRRLLLQGARAARGSPPLGPRLCDVEKGSNKNHTIGGIIVTSSTTSSSAGGGGGSGGGGGGASGSSNKVRLFFRFCVF